MHYLNVFPKEYFSSDENLTSDDESNTETSDEESIAGNASNTEQNLSSEDKTINPNTTTGEDFIIDENTDRTIELDNNKETCSISDTQNPDTKNETSNQALPLTI